jgi:hypothetical protein
MPNEAPVLQSRLPTFGASAVVIHHVFRPAATFQVPWSEDRHGADLEH